MADYLVDTNIFIDDLRGTQLFRDLLEQRFSKTEHHNFYYSLITELELLSGNDAKKAMNRQKIENILSYCKPLSVDKVIKEVATIRREYQLSLADAIIAAAAIVNNLKLVTRDKRSFRGIKELDAHFVD
ncbi:PIN domain-containing protein [Candidatus Berkelbacteria bacterium]|nr:PIN domain-containing protein [Candidatus Berkelbacteria bacterium]